MRAGSATEGLRGRLLWGLRQAAWYGVLSMIGATVIYVRQGEAPFRALGLTYLELTGITLAGIPVAGVVLGGTKPIVGRAIGAFLTGSVLMFLAAVAMLTVMPDSFAAARAGPGRIVQFLFGVTLGGGFAGLVAWALRRSFRSR